MLLNQIKLNNLKERNKNVEQEQDFLYFCCSRIIGLLRLTGIFGPAKSDHI